MKNKGRKFEDLFIKTINSGSFYQKGDAQSENECLEIKYRKGKGFNLTTKILKKIWDEAFNQNKFSMLGIGIEDGEDLWLLKINIAKKRVENGK